MVVEEKKGREKVIRKGKEERKTSAQAHDLAHCREGRRKFDCDRRGKRGGGGGDQVLIVP